jgi:hypothetical protein
MSDWPVCLLRRGESFARICGFHGKMHGFIVTSDFCGTCPLPAMVASLESAMSFASDSWEVGRVQDGIDAYRKAAPDE